MPDPMQMFPQPNPTTGVLLLHRVDRETGRYIDFVEYTSSGTRPAASTFDKDNKAAWKRGAKAMGW